MLDPVATEMEGGNIRQRPRPGDNVGTLTQTIWISAAEHDTFVAWVKDTLGNGTGRFTANVWLGTAYPHQGMREAWLWPEIRVAIDRQGRGHHDLASL
jgi:hypothetical protein